MSSIKHESKRIAQYFDLYWKLGDDRSIEILQKQCASYGLKTMSLHTLKTWSASFGWKARIDELKRIEGEKFKKQQVKEIEQARLRHIKVATDFEAISHQALAEIEKIRRDINERKQLFRVIDIRQIAAAIRDLTASVKEASGMESLNRGQPTEIQETRITSFEQFLQQALAEDTQPSDLEK